MAKRNPFGIPDLTEFFGLDKLGLKAIGQSIREHDAQVLCEVVGGEEFCRGCGAVGVRRDTVKRQLHHVPYGWRPTTLVLVIRRYACRKCHRVWQQDTSAAAEPRAKISRAGVMWGLFGVVVNHMAISSVATSLGVRWNTANDAILAAGAQLLINDPKRFDDVEIIGVDEHVWSHVTWSNKYVTVLIDLTPVKKGTGPARLLDLIPGRSKEVLKTWLEAQSEEFLKKVRFIAMDGFTGFKTAVSEVLPDAEVVLDPFHVVRLAGDALENVRRRVQQQTHGRRGKKGDPLYGARHTLMTGADLLKEKQLNRLDELFDSVDHAEVQATWGVYQQMVASYRNPKKDKGKKQMIKLIELLQTTIPKSIEELRKLGQTLNKRKDDILAYFDNPGTSNGPGEAINGRLEHLRGIALGFRNIVHYQLRALLECGGFRPRLHAYL